MIMLKEMESVYAVYEEQSFSRAARKLYVSQPALSAAVKKAEDELGAPIFDRSTNPIHLTAAGEYYIEGVKRILDIRREMDAYFKNLAEKRRQTVQFGAATYFCLHMMPELIDAFQQQYPEYQVSLLEANAADLRSCLRSGVIDLCLDVESEDSNRFQSIPWKEETLLLAVPSSFPINERLKDLRLKASDVRAGVHLSDEQPAVSMAEFSDEPFLLLKKDNDLHQRAFTICRNAGFTPQVSMQLDQMLTACYAACGKKGITFLRDGMAILPECDSRLFFYKIQDKNAKRNLFLSWKTSPPLSEQARCFLDFLLAVSHEF